jgi:hypothetical protein
MDCAAYWSTLSNASAALSLMWNEEPRNKRAVSASILPASCYDPSHHTGPGSH